MNETEFAYIFNVELEIPLKAVDEICQIGSNDEAVENNLNDFILEQLKEYPKERLIQAVEAYGIENVDKMTTHELYQYILWLGAWNIKDDMDDIENVINEVIGA